MFKNKILSKADIIGPPSKKEFRTMRELISDAEKYDNKDEIDLSKESLKSLLSYIQRYLNNTHPLQ